MHDAHISAKNLSFSYPQSPQIFTDLNFDITAGEFVLLCGRTGSGKTTLLRQLVPSLAPHGQLSGQLDIKGSVGFVQQDPDNQIVTDIVFHELAFALENQGLPTQTIRRKVAEIASYFGLEYLLESPTHTLSGGQKQILNLAATLVAEPDILVLDEPTSELDPIAAQTFLRHLVQINRELGTTVLCCEHRLDEVLTLCDKVLLLDAESSITSFTPQGFVKGCVEKNQDFIAYLPEPTQIAIAYQARQQSDAQLPLNVRSGRTWLKGLPLQQQAAKEDSSTAETAADIKLAKPLISLRDVCFRYDKHEPYVLRYLNAQFTAGQIHGIVGGNASGKSTLVRLIAGLDVPQIGKLRIEKGTKVAALPQNPKACFLHDTLQEDLQETAAATTKAAAAVTAIAEELNIAHLLDRHPYDLSGGEAQKAALAKLLLTEPDVLLLDEPTKGLDAQAKLEVGRIFKKLAAQGKTLIMVTHDLSFAALYTQTCALLANGELIAHSSDSSGYNESGQTHEFFEGNSFYTTPTNRMTRGIISSCVTVADATSALAQMMQAARTNTAEQQPQP